MNFKEELKDKNEEIYVKASSKMMSSNISEVSEAEMLFESIKGYKDSEVKRDICLSKCKNFEKERKMETAISIVSISIFISLLLICFVVYKLSLIQDKPLMFDNVEEMEEYLESSNWERVEADEIKEQIYFRDNHIHYFNEDGDHYSKSYVISDYKKGEFLSWGNTYIVTTDGRFHQKKDYYHRTESTYLIEKANAKEKAEELKKQEQLDELSKLDYPYLDMNESLLGYTKIGLPNKINPCLNFEYLVPSHRSKEYIWYNIDNHISEIHVDVWYRKYYSNNVDSYIDYPDGQGYVKSIWMIKDGKMITLDKQK